MTEQMYCVTCSECQPQEVLVKASELRDHLHGIFCMCDDPAACDNEYLCDFDGLEEEELVMAGIRWDLEDGWVSVEPVGRGVAT